jgi:hypothetical protein
MNDKKYKKLVLKIKYLRLEAEDSDDSLKLYINDFDLAFTEFCKSKLGDDYFKNETSEHAKLSKSAKEARKRNPKTKEYTPKQNSETDDFTKRELKPAKKKKVPQIFKKIYKKIAALTHPDRFLYLNPSGDEYKLKNKLYIKATTALEDNDYETLLDVMTELEIELDEVNSDIIEALKLKVNKLSNTISTIHNNPVWIWGHASQEQRFRIFEHIFKQRYKK